MPRGVYIRTEEHKKKISEALRGRTFTEEWKKKLSESQKGKHPSIGTRRKMSVSHKGKTLTDETKQKMSEASLRRKERDGYLQSPEARKKISERMRGKKNPNYGKELSEETKKKLSESMKGKKSYWEGKHLSEDHKKKLSESLSGEKHYNWNPNRAEVYAPYGENFYDKELRNKKWSLQNGRDMLSGVKLKLNREVNYHHIDYDKSNDELDNHCFLSINNHMRITGFQSNPIKSERYKRILQENTLALKNGQTPKYWSQINKELFRQEKLKQLDLSSYII